MFTARAGVRFSCNKSNLAGDVETKAASTSMLTDVQSCCSMIMTNLADGCIPWPVLACQTTCGRKLMVRLTRRARMPADLLRQTLSLSATAVHPATTRCFKRAVLWRSVALFSLALDLLYYL